MAAGSTRGVRFHCHNFAIAIRYGYPTCYIRRVAEGHMLYGQPMITESEQLDE